MVHTVMLIGCGGVGRTFLEMLPLSPIGNKIAKKYKKMVIVEPKDLTDEPTVDLIKKIDIKIVKSEMTKQNFTTLLNRFLDEGDLIIDVSYNVYSRAIIQYCLLHGIDYTNTSMERWPVEDEHTLEKSESKLYTRTLHYLNEEANIVHKKYPHKATAMLTNGMNPGLISQFTFFGLKKIAYSVLKEAKRQRIMNKNVKILSDAYKHNDFAQIANILAVRTIHCSERDTQVHTKKRLPDEFINTWSCYAFYGEGVDPIQLGWGTHEKKMPGMYFSPHTKNIVFKRVRGIDCIVRSYAPKLDKTIKQDSNGKYASSKQDGSIAGMLIPHSENDTISRALTIKDKSGKVIYRPSNYYVYSPCKQAWESISAVKKNEYKMLQNQHALRGNEIKSGEDAVGALIIMEYDPIKYVLHGDTESKPVSFWSGTILNIDQTRKMGFKYSGPTTVQVACSIMSAIKWIMENPKKGICYPENMSHEQVLKDCKKWLGTIFTDYVPFDIDDTTFVKGFLTSMVDIDL